MKTATLDRLHGIALIALMSLSAFYIAGIPEVKVLSLSPLIVGIIIGMIYANTLRCRMPKEWEPGIKFCTKRLLRLGIIFYGFRLTLSDVAAVAIYTGSTLHEVAHVAGAGNAMDPTDALGIAGTATITKMIRVMLLAPVLVVMSLFLSRRQNDGGKRKITMPWFAFLFIGAICVNTLLQHLCGAATVKDIPLNGAIEYADTFMLTMAMTALGTDTGIDKFRQAGAKPFLLAAMLYVWLIVGGYFITQAVTAAF